MFERWRGVLLAWAVCLCGTIGVLGHTPFDEILSKLSVIEGPVLTYYPAGSQDRAERMQRLMQEVTRYYQARAEVTLTVQLALVGRADVADANPPFAGMLPGTSPGPIHTVLLPVGRGHALDRVVRHVVEQSSALRRLGLSADELSDRFAELATLHELGHRYARAGLDPTPGWYSEFVAGYLASSFLTDRRPDDARLWGVFCAAFLEHVTPHSRPAGDFHVGVAADSYVWYLGSLQERVTGVRARYGAEFLKQVKDVLQRRASPDDWEGVRRVVERASPGFSEWSRRHHRTD